MKAGRASASIGSRVGILSAVRADLTGPSGDLLKRGLRESSITAAAAAAAAAAAGRQGCHNPSARR